MSQDHHPFNPETLAEALKKVLEDRESAKVYVFNEEEVDTIKKLIVLFTFTRRLGVLGKILLWFFTATGGAYLTFTKIFPGLIGHGGP